MFQMGQLYISNFANDFFRSFRQPRMIDETNCTSICKVHFEKSGNGQLEASSGLWTGC